MHSALWALGFPRGSVIKKPSAKAGDSDLIPGSERSPGEGKGKPLQCSCLGNSVDRGAWWAVVHGVAKESAMKQQQQHICSTVVEFVMIIFS